MLLLIVGGLMCLYGGIVVLINAFKTSVLWGLGSLFVPFVSLIFVAMHWADNMKPFLIYLGGIVLVFAGVAMSPDLQQQPGM
jgi:hypothetical protein